MKLEEYMQALLRIGFSREFVLERVLAQVEDINGYHGDHIAKGLAVFEEAAKACGIGRAAVEAEMYRGSGMPLTANEAMYEGPLRWRNESHLTDLHMYVDGKEIPPNL